MPDAAGRTGRILVVDDEAMTCEQLVEVLSAEGHEVQAFPSGELALAALEKSPVHLVLSDLRMPGMGGMTLLKKVVKDHPRTAVVIMTAHGSIETAVEAMRIGASDFLLKPFRLTEVGLVVARVLEKQFLRDENLYLREELEKTVQFGDMIGREARMREIFERILKIAPSDATVLITGETGTGKELVARAIHRQSPRRDRPFVAMNCAAVTETILESELFGHERGAFTGAVEQRAGKFELANGGTLFLDEVGNIGQPMQAKLLRVLEEREFYRVGGSKLVKVDVRVLVATNRDLDQAVAAGTFREDLYYRLRVVPVHIPPLRERKEDIVPLAEHFLAHYNKTLAKRIQGFTKDVVDRLHAYRWPGNVRELRNVVERAVLLATGDQLADVDLPGAPAASGAPTSVGAIDDNLPLLTLMEQIQERVEREYLDRLLKRFFGGIERTAKHAGITSRALYNKMKRYGLKKEDYR